MTGVEGQACLVPYYRVSTDDKGQRPERQAEICRPWAEAEKFFLLAPEVDEGTSASKVLALDRERFVRACERGKAAGAFGILMEAPDRFSRMDPFRAIWEFVEVKDRYGLEILFASESLAMQQSWVGRLVVFLKLALAHEWVVGHTKKVESGIALSKARGVQFGRKPKTFSEAEFAQMDAWRAEGLGFDLVAVKINMARGVVEMTDRKAARRLTVSKSSVRRAFERRAQNEMDQKED